MNVESKIDYAAGETAKRQLMKKLGAKVSEVRDREDPILVVAWSGDYSFAAEFTLALMVLNLRKETDERFQPEYVSFAHCPEDVSEVQRILRCEVRAGAPWSGLAVINEAWHMPFRRSDPILRRVLQQQADEIIARLPAANGVAVEVRRALAKQMAGGNTRIDSIPRDLATTSRTLQRQLAEVGISYQDLVDLTRREAAEKYPADLSLSMSEVAYLLGYSEPSVFHRAFKRWNGTTPQAFRRAQHATRSTVIADRGEGFKSRSKSR